MVIKLNLNTLLVVLGGLGIFAPDVAFIAHYLANQHITWLHWVSKGLGLVAAFFAAAPLAVPKLRAFLALFKLATPAGEVVPRPMLKLVPKDPNATPPPVIKNTDTKEAGFAYLGRMLILLALSILMLAAWLIPRLARAEENQPSLPTTPVIIAPVSAQPVLSTVPTAQPPATATPAPTAVTQPPASAAPTPASTAPTITPTEPVRAAPTPVAGYDSRYGSCKGNFCLAPALAIQAFQYVPSTGNMIGGVAFAGGYGLIWHTMIDLGLAFYGSVQFSRDKPFTVQGLAMFNIANYFAFGPGFDMLGQPSGPALFHLTICFAANWIPGLTQ